MNTPVAWSDIGFEVEITGDGSPSLRQLRSQVLGEEESGEKGESMHHSGGAAEETELIYGEPIRKCFAVIENPHFVSVGLGLGYVELVIARESLSLGHAFSLESWEILPELRQWFVLWLSDEALPLEVSRVYDRVLDFVAKEVPQRRSEIKAALREKLDQNLWSLKGALTTVEKPKLQAHGLLFDAFSAKTTPALWTEEFLTEYFSTLMAKDSFVSTYASRTTLKRALSNVGFQLSIRPGFKNKRNSTLAFKGKLETTFAPAGIS